MPRFGNWLVGLAILGAAGLWFTRPQTLDADAFATLTGDAANGQIVFAAMGCASCHKVKDGDPLVLAGGHAFKTGFGTFYAPNISSDATYGIGGWTDVELADAVLHGTLKGGRHSYPAFPYTSYNKTTQQDVADMIAYLRTLPADPTPSLDHDVGFPFNIRASLGGWKMLFMSDDWVMKGDLDPELERGRYLVEALGHCAECHTPRNALGGLDRSKWLQGAADPSGEGKIPGIAPDVLFWSASDIAEYLSSGFTPEFDVVGGSMFDVVQNTAQLTDADRAAIAAYIKALPTP